MKWLRIILFLLTGIAIVTPGFGLPAKGTQVFKTAFRQPQSLREILSSYTVRRHLQYQFHSVAKQGKFYFPNSFLPSRVALTPKPPLRLEHSTQRALVQLPQENPQIALFSKQHVDAFIFDLDGTLLDSLDAWENSAVNYLRSHGIEPYPGLQEEMEELSLLDGARIIKEYYQLEETPEELIEETLKPIGEHYYQDIPAKAQVPFLLSYLREQGIKMVVATASHIDFARGALERLGLLDYFEFIITCDEVGAGKRNPLVYETATERLGTEKSRTVVVEDALYALKTAHDAGFKTIGVADVHSSEDSFQIQQTADLFLDLE